MLHGKEHKNYVRLYLCVFCSRGKDSTIFLVVRRLFSERYVWKHDSFAGPVDGAGRSCLGGGNRCVSHELGGVSRGGTER